MPRRVDGSLICHDNIVAVLAELWRRGLSSARIAHVFDVTDATVRNLASRRGLPRRGIAFEAADAPVDAILDLPVFASIAANSIPFRCMETGKLAFRPKNQPGMRISPEGRRLRRRSAARAALADAAGIFGVAI